MAIRFTGASTQYLTNSAPLITARPFTVGMWVRLDAVGTVARTIWGLSDTASTNNYFMLRMTSGELLQIAARGGSTESSLNCGALGAGAWHFIVGRFISATNDWASNLQPSGIATHANRTASRAPSGMDVMTLGALSTSGGITEPWNGRIAEFWYTDTDIQPDAAQLQDSTLRKLAFEGPFSIPHIGSRVLEYRSFWSVIDSRSDKPEEVYHRKTRQVWAQTNGPTLEAHAPAASRWVPPREARRVLVV